MCQPKLSTARISKMSHSRNRNHGQILRTLGSFVLTLNIYGFKPMVSFVARCRAGSFESIFLFYVFVMRQ